VAHRLDALPERRLPGGLRLAVARGGRARLCGLAFLDEIPPDRALLFERCRSVHTFGMRFALDLVWLDGGGAVVRVDGGVRPRRLRSCRRAASVVEVATGAGALWAAVLDALAAAGQSGTSER
jgi:uncharacterized membrane protein (UPF0127 family)